MRTSRSDVPGRALDGIALLRELPRPVPIHGTTEVRAAYDAFVTAAQREAGPQMTAAWEDKPSRRTKTPLHTSPLPRVATDAARAQLLAILQADLNR